MYQGIDTIANRHNGMRSWKCSIPLFYSLDINFSFPKSVSTTYNNGKLVKWWECYNTKWCYTFLFRCFIIFLLQRCSNYANGNWRDIIFWTKRISLVVEAQTFSFSDILKIEALSPMKECSTNMFIFFFLPLFVSLICSMKFPNSFILLSGIWKFVERSNYEMNYLYRNNIWYHITQINRITETDWK